ncbi:hypothetical protein GE21DRAFT_1287228 [Neurospora crassa]|nr:hypothetical protein GE21DRAFT_1287228 [Neurospora crassa]
MPAKPVGVPSKYGINRIKSMFLDTPPPYDPNDSTLRTPVLLGITYAANRNKSRKSACVQ